jgi:hypothetical protein
LELGAINDPSDHIISCSYYYSSSFFLSSVKSLPDTFLGDALIKLYEILYEYHMPCEVVPLRVDFFKMAAVAMVTTKMPKNSVGQTFDGRKKERRRIIIRTRNDMI